MPCAHSSYLPFKSSHVAGSSDQPRACERCVFKTRPSCIRTVSRISPQLTPASPHWPRCFLRSSGSMTFTRFISACTSGLLTRSSVYSATPARRSISEIAMLYGRQKRALCPSFAAAYGAMVCICGVHSSSMTSTWSALRSFSFARSIMPSMAAPGAVEPGCMRTSVVFSASSQ